MFLFVFIAVGQHSHLLPEVDAQSLTGGQKYYYLSIMAIAASLLMWQRAMTELKNIGREPIS